MEKYKLIGRYTLIVFICTLAWIVIQPGYANSVKDIGEIATAAIYGSVFGALTMVVNKHFSESIDKD